MNKTTENKVPKKPVPVIPTDEKILQELKLMNDTLNGIKNILDNMWRERRPT